MQKGMKVLCKAECKRASPRPPCTCEDVLPCDTECKKEKPSSNCNCDSTDAPTTDVSNSGCMLVPTVTANADGSGAGKGVDENRSKKPCPSPPHSAGELTEAPVIVKKLSGNGTKT